MVVPVDRAGGFFMDHLIRYLQHLILSDFLRKCTGVCQVVCADLSILMDWAGGFFVSFYTPFLFLQFFCFFVPSNLRTRTLPLLQPLMFSDIDRLPLKKWLSLNTMLKTGVSSQNCRINFSMIKESV